MQQTLIDQHHAYVSGIALYHYSGGMCCQVKYSNKCNSKSPSNICKAQSWALWATKEYNPDPLVKNFSLKWVDKPTPMQKWQCGASVLHHSLRIFRIPDCGHFLSNDTVCFLWRPSIASITVSCLSSVCLSRLYIPRGEYNWLCRPSDW